MFKTFEINLPYFLTKVDKHEEIKDEVLYLIENEPSSHIRNKPPYELVKTDYAVENSKTEKEYWLKIRSHLYRSIYQPLSSIGFRTLNLGKYWYQQYSKGGFHYPHIHSGVDWTSIYFLELPNKNSATTLASYTSSTTVLPPVEEGYILTFPGLVPHFSPEILDNNSRKTVIVFNLRSEYEPYLRD